MDRRRSFWAPFVAFTVSLLVQTATHADIPQNSLRQAKIRELIENLGSGSFRERDRATRELLEIGIEAKDALMQSLNHPALEVRRRCSQILPAILFDDCWRKAAKLLGESVDAKKQFEVMYSAEKELWIAFARKSTEMGQLYATRCRDLTQPPDLSKMPAQPAGFVDFERYQTTPGNLTSLLVLGAECRDQIPKETLQSAAKLLRQNWGSQYAKETPPPLRNAYVIWAETIGGLPIEYEGAKKWQIARQILRSTDASSSERRYALLDLVCTKDQEDDLLIRGLLQDESICDTLFTKGVKTQIQLRDVALAALIYRSGKNPLDFGVAIRKTDNNASNAPTTIGFRNEAERAAAFQKWKETVSAESGSSRK